MLIVVLLMGVLLKRVNNFSLSSKIFNSKTSVLERLNISGSFLKTVK